MTSPRLPLLARCVPLLCCAAVLCLSLPVAADITLDGNIHYDTEWTGPGALTFSDAAGDVTAAFASGYDLVAVSFFLDVPNNALFIGLDARDDEIMGDADGNGNPSLWGTTDPETGSQIDPADYGYRTVNGATVGESFGILFDMDLNGSYDYVAGVSPQGSYPTHLGLFSWSGGTSTVIFTQAFWGTQVATGFLHSPTPSSGAPSIEFEIPGFPSLVQPADSTSPWDFNFVAANGATAPSPVGEDLVAGHVPEPGSAALLALAGLALLGSRRQRRA